MTSSSAIAGPPAGNLNFVLVCVFIDMLGIGLIVPVLPLLVGEFGAGRDRQALWFGLLTTVFGPALALVVARRYFRSQRA